MHIDPIIKQVFTPHFFSCQKLCLIHYVKCMCSWLCSKRRNPTRNTDQRNRAQNKEEMYKILATCYVKMFQETERYEQRRKIHFLCYRHIPLCTDIHITISSSSWFSLHGRWSYNRCNCCFLVTQALALPHHACSNPFNSAFTFCFRRLFNWRFTLRTIMKQIGTVFFSIICVKYCHRDRKTTLIMK